MFEGSPHPLEPYRNPKEVQGTLGKFLITQVAPMEVVRKVWALGEGVPLGLMPSEFWRDNGRLRFDEVALGDGF